VYNSVINEGALNVTLLVELASERLLSISKAELKTWQSHT